MPARRRAPHETLYVLAEPLLCSVAVDQHGEGPRTGLRAGVAQMVIARLRQ